MNKGIPGPEDQIAEEARNQEIFLQLVITEHIVLKAINKTLTTLLVRLFSKLDALAIYSNRLRDDIVNRVRNQRLNEALYYNQNVAATLGREGSYRILAFGVLSAVGFRHWTYCGNLLAYIQAEENNLWNIAQNIRTIRRLLRLPDEEVPQILIEY